MSYNPLEIEEQTRLRTARTRELRAEEERNAELVKYRPELNRKQSDFLDIFSSNPHLGIREICNQIGIRRPTYDKWMAESEDFRKALNIHYNRMLATTKMSRKRVMQGLLESIDMAKDMRQPNSMITGWKEIGRMCGFYEPERREITLSVNSKEILEEITTLSRDKLLEMAADQDIIEGEIVSEAEFHEISKDPGSDS